jgi:hypothetical protein
MEHRVVKRSIWIGAVVGLLAGGCYDGGGEMRDTATLRVRVEPDTARVSIDDRYVARARTLDAEPRALEAGEHLLTIEADGFFPHDLAVDLAPGETTVEVRLRPIPP